MQRQRQAGIAIESKRLANVYLAVNSSDGVMTTIE